jgi:hypothetical protein
MPGKSDKKGKPSMALSSRQIHGTFTALRTGVGKMLDKGF